MQPVFLWRFLQSSLNVTTISLTAGASATIYSPYVLAFDAMDFSLEQGNNFGAVASVSVTLARNTFTNALLSGAQSGTAVEVDLAFYKGVNIPQADLMPMARFIFGGIGEITQAQFTVMLLADERKLKNLPLNRLVDVNLVPEQNKTAFIPLALGQFNGPAEGLNNRMFAAKGHDYLPCILANELYNADHTYSGVALKDIGEILVAENKVGTTTAPTTQRVYEYLDSFEVHSAIRGSTADANDAVYFNSWEYTNGSGDAYLPGGVTAGKIRLTKNRVISRLIEVDAPGNLINSTTAGSKFTWKNLSDSDPNNVTRLELGLSPARNFLTVGWGKKGSPSPVNPDHGYILGVITNGDKTTGGGTRVKFRTALVSNGVLSSTTEFIDITGSTTFPLAFPFGKRISSSAIGNGTFGGVGWNWDNVLLQIEVSGIPSGGTTQFVEFSSLGVDLAYLDENFAFKRATAVKFVRGSDLVRTLKVPGLGGKSASTQAHALQAAGLNPSAEYIWPTSFEFVAKTDKVIYADYNSATNINTAGFGGTLFAGPWMLYAILGDVLGFPAAQIDGLNFTRVADFFSIAYQVGALGIYIDRERAATEILRVIAFESNLLLFYGGEGVWKLAPKWKYITGAGYDAPVTQFADNSETYIVAGLKWAILEPVYNKFRALCRFDFALGQYVETVTNDQTGAVPNGKPFDDIELLYLRNTAAATAWLTNFVAFHTQRRRVVEFNTTLAAAHLELGDYIKVGHTALPDNIPTYQIVQIIYNSIGVFIRAISV